MNAPFTCKPKTPIGIFLLGWIRTWRFITIQRRTKSRIGGNSSSPIPSLVPARPVQQTLQLTGALSALSVRSDNGSSHVIGVSQSADPTRVPRDQPLLVLFFLLLLLLSRSNTLSRRVSHPSPSRLASRRVHSFMLLVRSSGSPCESARGCLSSPLTRSLVIYHNITMDDFVVLPLACSLARLLVNIS